MSTYHYGILAYGYDLGHSEEYAIREIDQNGYVNLAWVKRDEDGWVAEELPEAFRRRLYEAIPAANPDAYTWEYEDAIKKHFGVMILEHGWLAEADTASYALVASKKFVAGGDTEPIDLEERIALAKSAKFDEKLENALKVLGVTPLQEKPSWLLMASR